MNLSVSAGLRWSLSWLHECGTNIIPLILFGHRRCGMWTWLEISALTRMGDWKAVGRLEVVYIVVEVERLLSGVLVGVVELDSEPERAVLLHRRTHEQSPLKRWKPKIRQHTHTRLCAFFLCVLDFFLYGDAELCTPYCNIKEPLHFFLTTVPASNSQDRAGGTDHLPSFL